MPSSLAVVIKRIDVSLFNDRNKRLIQRFVDFMTSTDISAKYQKDNPFVIFLYARYLGNKELSAVNRKEDIIEFLNTKRKDTTIALDQKWIRTWNDYLQRIKYFDILSNIQGRDVSVIYSSYISYPNFFPTFDSRK
ncbi:MAG: hypothetical protein WBV84_04495 [Nitrososphaeraceae archaeon]